MLDTKRAMPHLPMPKRKNRPKSHNGTLDAEEA
jgi:hypothetical protein